MRMRRNKSELVFQSFIVAGFACFVVGIGPIIASLFVSEDNQWNVVRFGIALYLLAAGFIAAAICADFISHQE